jgi:hypothetical protein
MRKRHLRHGSHAGTDASTDGNSCTSAATCSGGVCDGMAPCRAPNSFASCTLDADCWGGGQCSDANDGASCSLTAASTGCTGQGQCIRDTIAWVTLAGSTLTLFNLAAGARPFKTVIMQVKWDLAASSPVPGAYSEYLVVFRLESYDLPAGSKLIVTGLNGASASSTTAIYPPRPNYNCDARGDISSFFAHGQRVGYAEWNSVNKSVTLTLRNGFTTGLVRAPQRHAFRFEQHKIPRNVARVRMQHT